MNSVDNVTVAKSPAEVADRIRSVFGQGAVLEVRERKAGKDDTVGHHDSWAKVERDRFLDFVELWPSSISPVSYYFGNDDGGVVTLYYHFTLFQVAADGTASAWPIAVPVDKKDLVMPSLFSRIPGVEYSERETREMFGVDFDGLPKQGSRLPSRGMGRVHQAMAQGRGRAFRERRAGAFLGG